MSEKTRGQPKVPFWPLPVLAGAVVILWLTGAIPAWSGVIHLVALPPLGMAADQRILFSLAPSYPVFGAGVALSLLVRTSILALLLGGLDRRRVGFALRYNLLAAPFTLASSAMLFASPATLYYGLFWAGLALLILAFVLLGALPWLGFFSLRRGLSASAKHCFRAGTLLAYLGLLFLLGLAAELTGPAGTILLVPVSAVLTLAALHVLTSDFLVVSRRLLAAVMAAGLATPVIIAMTGPAEPAVEGEHAPSQPGSLLIMSGVDSASGEGAIFEIDPRTLGYSCEQTYYYSYAGPGDGAPQGEAFCPIRTGAPYGPADTLRSADDLVPFFHEQTAEMPEPVVVLAHSQAVWITWLALAEVEQSSNALGAAGVSTAVLIGPFFGNIVAYPPHRDAMPGRAGTDVIALIANLPRPGGTSAFSPGAPLAREFLADPTGIERAMAEPVPPDVRVLSIPSAFDLPLLPTDWRVESISNACPVPVLHPDLPYARELRELIVGFLNEGELGRCPTWRTMLGPLSLPFGVPPNVDAWGAPNS